MSAEEVLDLAEEIQRQIERHRETNWTELEPEKRAFGIAFLSSPTPRKAAELANLPESSGTRHYKDPVVRAYISYLQEIQAGNSIINAQYLDSILLYLLPIFLGEEKAPLVVPGVGLLEERKLHGPELMRALDMLAKRSGYYNADLSQGGIVAVLASLQEIGRKAQLEETPIDPREFRKYEGDLVEFKEPKGGA